MNRFITIPFELRLEHRADEPPLADIIKWLRGGGLVWTLRFRGLPKGMRSNVCDLIINWDAVTERLADTPPALAYLDEE